MIRIILYISLISLVSCDLISTREPEIPDTAKSNFVPATTPDLLFANLTNSFKEKIVENYLACFIDPLFLNKEFIFIPSAGSNIQFDIFSDWNIFSERQYFNNVKSASLENTPIILDLTNPVSNIYGDSAIFQYDYSIFLQLENESISYKGNCQFNIHNDSRNQWVITRWEDVKSEDFPSWSELKGNYY